MRRVLAGVAAITALALSLPAAAAALPSAATTASSATTATSAATSASASSVAAVQGRAANGVATADQVVSGASSSAPAVAEAKRIVPQAKPTVPDPTVPDAKPIASRMRPPARLAAPAPTSRPDAAKSSRLPAAGGLPERGAVSPADARPSSPVRGQLPTEIEPASTLQQVSQPLRELAGGALRDLMVAPVDGLLTPLNPLLGGPPLPNGRDLLGGLPDLVAVVSPDLTPPPLSTQARAPSAAALGVHAEPPTRPAASAAAAPQGGPGRSFQAASATPRADELGGRPASPAPRTAPAPVAGGATAVFSGGSFFVPFLGLLVLAALAAPRLLRRLDELPAFVRPAPFLCALERPG